MNTILKSFTGFAILALTSTLISMTPAKGPDSSDLKVHIIHEGKRLCIPQAAANAHSRKHIGHIDCGFAGYCTPQSASFHAH